MYKPMQNRPRGCAAVNGSGLDMSPAWMFHALKGAPNLRDGF